MLLSIGLCATLALALTAVAAPADASTAQDQLVSAVPAAATPNIDDGVVYAIVQVGSTIVVGGTFTSVTPSGSTTPVTRNQILAFDATTGALTSFAPSLDGTVNALLPGPTANTVYVGGSFTNVGSTKSKGVALLDLSSGAPVAGFKAPVLNGQISGLDAAGGHLFIVGGFTTVAGVLHQGIATLNPTTGALDPYVNVQLTGHHNYNGSSGAKGALGGRSIDITPDGTRAVVVGNFKNANGVVHDQVAMLDLGADQGVVDPNWNTSQFSAPCASNSFDSYVEQVSFAPDGSYFAIADTGGSTFSTNTDGSRSLCDSASRWETSATGTNVQPTWVDYTGNDTFWSVAVTGTAIYVGGHARWVNNPVGSDSAGAGAVPRPGIAALDPASGLPFSWNPGRNPRGAGAYALLATSTGLYVGSDTDYIGNFRYKRAKIAFFPLAGGSVPSATTTAQLPGNLYQAGPLSASANATPNDLTYRSVNGNQVGSSTTVAPNANIAWSNTRGAFLIGDYVYTASTDANFYRAPFDGTTIGTPMVLDAYEDPAWSSVQTGSGQTYKGVKPGYYSEINSITGEFYSNGRLYYSMSGQSKLYWRWFQPDSGVIGQTEYTVTGADFSVVAGMTLSGTTLYYADRNTGVLHSLPFVNGVPDGTQNTTLAAPGVDWRAHGLFIRS